MAHYFEWIESYSVRVEALDDDHRVLVRLVDKAIRAILDHQPAEVSGKVLDELVAYSVGHFRREEALMEQSQYPLLTQHRAAHDRLIRQVAEFIVDFRNQRLNVGDVGEFLMNWLLTHTLGADKLYTDHFNARGIF